MARKWFRIRAPIPLWAALLLGVICVALCFGAWWFVTTGEEAHERIVSPITLPSPAETFATFKSLWVDRALTRNTLMTLERVVLGFSLALLVGVPVGVMAGCFPPLNSFLAPLIVFGRNISLAALIPLTFIFFGIGETQKVMFIFLACVAFVIADTANAVVNVGSQYIDTAYTLGANRRHVILKVLVPLAMPSIFNSARLLFGLAFGYIMLAEMIKLGDDEVGGLGHLILISQKRGIKEHIYLIILIIPVVALALDRFLFWIQRELFPHRYGGAGMLNQLVRGVLHLWDDTKRMVVKPKPPFDQLESLSSQKAVQKTS